MTREEAIAYGKECLSWNKFSREHAMYQFIEMAISALESLAKVEDANKATARVAYECGKRDAKKIKSKGELYEGEFD